MKTDSRTKLKLDSVLLLFAIFLFVAAALLAMSEVTGRISLAGVAEQELFELQARAVGLKEVERSDLLRKINQVEGIRADTRSLITIGGVEGTNTLLSLVCRLTAIEPKTTITISNCYGNSLQKLMAPLYALRSETLIALIVIVCGAIGTSASVLAAPNGRFLLRRGAFSIVALGICAGFICYLVLRGGKFIFIINAGTADELTSNPYSMALAGVVIGLFAEEMYSRLDSFIQRSDIGNALHQDKVHDGKIEKQPEINEEETPAGSEDFDADVERNSV